MKNRTKITLRCAVAILLTGLSLLFLFDENWQPTLQIDPSPTALGAPDSPTEHLSLMIRTELTPEFILALNGLGRQVRKIGGVEWVRSIANVELPFNDNGDVEINSLATRVRQNPADAPRWIQIAVDDPLVKGLMVTPDLQASLVTIAIRAETYDQRLALLDEIERLIAQQLAALSRDDWKMSGRLVVSNAIGNTLISELGVTLPLAILFFAALLWCAFQRVLVILGALITVVFAIVWTLGLAAGLGWSLNLVTIVVPPLVLALSVAYAMHVISAFADRGELEAGLRSIFLPLAATTITTAIGLLALAVNDLESIRQFAMLGAAGAVFAAIASITVLPIALMPLSSPPRLWPSVRSALVRWASWIADYVIHHANTVIKFSVFLLALILLAATQVQPGAQYIRDLPPEHPARSAYDQISSNFGGANSFVIKIEAAGADAILLPEILQAVDEFQRWLEAQPEIGATRSLPDYVKRVHQAFTEGTPESYRIPTDSILTKQLLVIGAPKEVYDYTNLKFSRLTIKVQTDHTNSRVLRELFDRIQKQFETLPAGLEPRFDGDAVVLTETIEQLTGGQIQSLSIAAFAIFIVLALIFASFQAGLLALLPNVLPVAAFFGLLGITGIPLGPTTALVACIVLGIAVDDTMHLLVRFNELARQHADEKRASRQAVEEVIRPITLTTIAISAGFFALVGSSFESQVAFGVLAAITLIIAWVSDLFLAPAVAARTSIVTMWDVLRLDLGDDPHKTIPLFEDMTKRQARVVALAGKMQTVRSGENLIELGQSASDMYVIVEGQFRIWVPRRDGDDLTIATRGRGTVLGESGLFFQKRTANVTAESTGRVLMFDNDALEHLRRRHPWAGALTYRNLNRIQAERLADNTKRFLNETEVVNWRDKLERSLKTQGDAKQPEEI